MNEKTIFTYQTRLRIDDADSQVLDEYAELFGKVERSLFADFSAGKNPLKLKNSYLKRFGITARQFNACRTQIMGKIDSYQQQQIGLIANLIDHIASLKYKIEKLERKKDNQRILHQKKRRLSTLEHRLERLKEDQKQEKIRLCFGGKKLFRAQFH